MELEENNLKELDPDGRLLNKLMYVVAGVIIVIFLSMTTCTMHSNTYDPQRAKEETAEAEAKYKAAEADAEVQLAKAKLESQIASEKLKTLENMVKDGANPIAARCAIVGWEPDDVPCIVAAGKDAPKNITE